MATRRISKSAINWAAFAERVPEEQKHMFQNFKMKSDGYLKKVLGYPEAPPQINWSHYKENVPIAGLVDSFQKSYSALNVPYPKENMTPLIEAQEKEAEKEVKAYVKGSQDNVAEYKKQLEKWESMLPFDQMTMEDFQDNFPDLCIDFRKTPSIWPHNEFHQEGATESEKTESK